MDALQKYAHQFRVNMHGLASELESIASRVDDPNRKDAMMAALDGFASKLNSD
jgi:hypothetical protein